MIGPAIGGYAYAITPSAAYFTAAVLFAIGLVSFFLVGPVPRTVAAAAARPMQQIADGLKYVWQNKLVLGAITLDLFAVFLAGTSALLPIYAHDILKVGPTGLSELAAAPGVGAALTALWFSIRPLRTNVGPKMLGAVIVYGTATVIFGTAVLGGKSSGSAAARGIVGISSAAAAASRRVAVMSRASAGCCGQLIVSPVTFSTTHRSPLRTTWWSAK